MAKRRERGREGGGKRRRRKKHFLFLPSFLSFLHRRAPYVQARGQSRERERERNSPTFHDRTRRYPKRDQQDKLKIEKKVYVALERVFKDPRAFRASTISLSSSFFSRHVALLLFSLSLIPARDPLSPSSPLFLSFFGIPVMPETFSFSLPSPRCIWRLCVVCGCNGRS